MVRTTSLMIGVLLLGIFTLKLKLPVVLAIGSSALLFGAAFLGRLAISKAGLIVLLNYGYWLASGFASGAVVVSDLVTPTFYSAEGRILMYYMPFLLFSVRLPLGREDIAYVPRIVVLLASVSLALFVVWLVTHSKLLSSGAADNFSGLLASHTGSGTFFGFMVIFLTLFGLYAPGKRHCAVFGLLMLLPVIGAASRQSLIGIFVTMAWYLTREFQVRKVMISLTLVCSVLGMAFFAVPHMYQRSKAMFSHNVAESVIRQVAYSYHSPWQPGDQAELVGEEANILARMVLWTHAVKRIVESPLLGIGFGRYDDHVTAQIGRKGLLYFAVAGINRHEKGASAHNSYLHFLAETGVVGLGMILWFWKTLYGRLRRAACRFGAWPELKAYYMACQGLVVFTLTGALFDHGLASPSIGIPVLTVCGVGLCHYSWATRRRGLHRRSDPGLSLSGAGGHWTASPSPGG